MLIFEDKEIRAIFSKRPPITQRVFVLVALSALLLFLDSHGLVGKNVRYGIQSIVAPLQYTVNFPSNLFHKTLTAFASQESLLEENQTLKTELILLKLQQQRFLDLESENQQLRALLQSSQEAQIQVKLAEVLFVAAGVRSSKWVLNKGSRDGVYLGQAVLDAQGILGQVIMLGPKTSQVMLISDPKSSVPVESLTTGLRSIVQGEGADQPLTLAFIPKTETVAVGDTLVSSGAGGRFPKGYPVGKISAVTNHASEQFLSITVTPVAQLDHERFVLLLWPQGLSFSQPSSSEVQEDTDV